MKMKITMRMRMCARLVFSFYEDCYPTLQTFLLQMASFDNSLQSNLDTIEEVYRKKLNSKELEGEWNENPVYIEFINK